MSLRSVLLPMILGCGCVDVELIKWSKIGIRSCLEFFTRNDYLVNDAKRSLTCFSGNSCIVNISRYSMETVISYISSTVTVARWFVSYHVTYPKIVLFIICLYFV